MLLSKRMLDLLIEHLDGPVHNVKKSNTMTAARDNHLRARAVYDAFAKGFIKYAAEANGDTVLSDAGKRALCRDLAEMAETLLRAKFTPGFQPPPGLALPSVSPDIGTDPEGKIVHNL